MEFLGILFASVWVAAIGALVLLILAIIQEGRVGGKGTSVRQGFYAATSLVLLTIGVTAITFLLNLALTTWVFTNAPYSSRGVIQTPPPLVVSQKVEPTGSTSYTRTCTTTSAEGIVAPICQFTTDEVASIRQWAVDFANFKREFAGTEAQDQQRRRDFVNALSFLLVTGPLFFVFYRLLRRRETGAPLVVGSVYHYYVAFAGLVMTVVSSALLINVGLKAATGVTDTPPTIATPRPLVGDPQAEILASVERCAAACGFTSSEVAAAREWRTDYAANSDLKSQSTTSKQQGDLASNLPLLAVGLPLFLFHFREARRIGAPPEEPKPVRTTRRIARRPARRKK